MSDELEDRYPGKVPLENFTEADRKTFRRAALVNAIACAALLGIGVLALAFEDAFSDRSPGFSAQNNIALSNMP